MELTIKQSEQIEQLVKAVYILGYLDRANDLPCWSSINKALEMIKTDNIPIYELD